MRVCVCGVGVGIAVWCDATLSGVVWHGSVQWSEVEWGKMLRCIVCTSNLESEPCQMLAWCIRLLSYVLR